MDALYKTQMDFNETRTVVVVNISSACYIFR